MDLVRDPLAKTLCSWAQQLRPEEGSAALDPAAALYQQLLRLLYRSALETHCRAHHLPLEILRSSWLWQTPPFPDTSLPHCVTTLETPAPLGELIERYPLLLSWHPLFEGEHQRLTLVHAAGHRRKLTGSYYTPGCLSECLLSTTLDPLLAESTAIAALPVCDPACGTGHLLHAAGARLVQRLAQQEAGTEAAHPSVLRDIWRQVVRSSLFGVDHDPLAVELCKIRLWLECGADEASWEDLQGQIRQGDSLVGLSPRQDAPTEGADVWCARSLGVADETAFRPFLHWRQTWPDLFKDATCGFAVVIGNPPWGRLKIQEREWFAARAPAVVEAPEAATRRRRIARLAQLDPRALAAFHDARDKATALARFIRCSGRFPLSARGDLNTYGLFVETGRMLLSAEGRLGMIVPAGLACHHAMKDLFHDLLAQGQLVCWYDFSNRRRLFPHVEGNVKFGLLTLTLRRQATLRLAAQLEHPDQLTEPDRIETLTAAALQKINPLTGHCPSFRRTTDLRRLLRLHERFPVLLPEQTNPWGVRLSTMFHMTADAHHFRTEKTLRAEGCRPVANRFVNTTTVYLPLYEAKLVQQYTHRAGTFADVSEAGRYRMHAGVKRLPPASEWVWPRYWIDEQEVLRRSGKRRWFLALRNAISAVADARSLVASILPWAGVGNSLVLVSLPDPRRACLLLALLNSYVLDHVLRQKANGSNLNFHILRQLPVPPPLLFEQPCPWLVTESLADWMVARVVELTHTSRELCEFAQECGFTRSPCMLDEEQRLRLRCDLDAACLWLYGIGTEEAAVILSDFTIVEKREQKRWGSARSRALILQRLAMTTG